MTVYHVAASLEALLREVNHKWPVRDKSSDGALGDAAHAARESDHNPDYDFEPSSPRYGVVRARDLDKDGIDMPYLLDQLRRECMREQPRVAYVIFNHRMMRSYPKTIGDHTYQPGEWAPYDGPNPHEGHAHVSVNHTAAAENDTSPWFIEPEVPEVTEQQADRIIALLTDLTSKVGELASQGRTMAVRMDSITNQQFPALRADVDRAADAGPAGPDATQP